jgi:UTP--glucose-1-phosphate uridylyltransferase
MLEELKKYDNVNFHVVYQNEMKGDGHAILQAHYWVKTEPVAVLFGDDLIIGKKNGLQQLVAAYEEVKSKRDSAFLCLQKVPDKLVSKYGIVAVDDAKSKGRLKSITGLVEKPLPKNAPSNLGIVGKYLIPRSTIEVLHRTEAGHYDKEIRLIDALKSQLGTMDVYGYEFEGQRLDTGTPEGYREAVSVLC